MFKVNQAEFFNKKPTFYPFRKILIDKGYGIFFRPRDLEWRKFFSKLSLQPKEKVLEVGCGTGVTLLRLEKTYRIRGWGIDVAGDSIKTAKSLGGSAQFSQGSATKLPFKDAMFDVVYSMDVLEHIEDQERAILEMVRVLKRGGRILIYTINKKQKFTFNWVLDKLGVDIYKNVAHDPRLFVDAKIVEKLLKNNKISEIHISYYDAFFSLGINLIITLILMFIPKVVIKPSSIFYSRLLNAVSFLSSIVNPLAQILDLPWLIRGYSNSLFVIGKKIK